jgi:hypothetical protein
MSFTASNSYGSFDELQLEQLNCTEENGNDEWERMTCERLNEAASGETDLESASMDVVVPDESDLEKALSDCTDENGNDDWERMTGERLSEAPEETEDFPEFMEIVVAVELDIANAQLSDLTDERFNETPQETNFNSQTTVMVVPETSLSPSLDIEKAVGLFVSKFAKPLCFGTASPTRDRIKFTLYRLEDHCSHPVLFASFRGPRLVNLHKEYFGDDFFTPEMKKDCNNAMTGFKGLCIAVIVERLIRMFSDFLFDREVSHLFYEYLPQLPGQETIFEDERDRLFQFFRVLCWMVRLQIPSNRGKLLFIFVGQLLEGAPDTHHRLYSLGGTKAPATERRVKLFELLTGVKPGVRLN